MGILRDDRGQSLAELALILPVLMVCFAGVVQLAEVRNTQIRMNMAARHGAGVAVNGGDGESAIREMLVSSLDLSDDDVDVRVRMVPLVSLVQVEIACRVRVLRILRQVIEEPYRVTVSYTF